MFPESIKGLKLEGDSARRRSLGRQGRLRAKIDSFAKVVTEAKAKSRISIR